MSPRQDDWSRLRQLPLRQIALRLGYRRDPRDRNRFRRDGSVINITGMKFYDHRQNRGGGTGVVLSRREEFRATGGTQGAHAIPWPCHAMAAIRGLACRA